MKKIITLFFLLLSFVYLTTASDIYAAEEKFKKCYTEPKMPKLANGQVDKAKVKREVLDPNGVAVTASGREINYEVLYRHHVVVYGNPHTDATVQSFCGSRITMYRYLGYDQAGKRVSNPFFRVDIPAKRPYFLENTFYANPWNTSSNPYQKWAVGGNLPKPVKVNISTEDLNRAWDTIDGTDSNPQGNLEAANMLGENLRPYASIDVLPGKFSFGVFNVYSTGGCIRNVCYSTHLIPPQQDILATKHDASVTLEVKDKFKNEKLNGTFTIHNDGSKNEPLSISSPCDNTKNSQKAQCKNTNRYGGIVITRISDGKEMVRKNVTFTDIARGHDQKIALSDYDFLVERSGQYEIYVWIPHYTDLNGKEESTYTNNAIRKTITIEVDQNASVKITGKTTYTTYDALSNVITVSNKTNNLLSGEVTIKILDNKGNVYKTLPKKTYNNLALNGTFSFDLQEQNILLPTGTYTIQASIPEYRDFPETNYDDNVDNFSIRVRVFVPENTKCNKITTNQTNVLAFNGKDPGITRACIGWIPNYPSTRVEGGQGTYFYFAYKLFPTPMPAYKVTTMDKLGLEQAFELKEPTNTLGSCDFKLANDTTCALHEPFLYYPARWENRFGTDTALSSFKGPYTVGPHEFYHYRYRGRLVPQQITFHYDIIDMEQNEKTIPLAFGDIVYDVPPACYKTEVIDIKEECRLIEFFVPIEKKQGTYKLPEDGYAIDIPKERIIFYNTGEHIFRVTVDEKQMYLYQSDEGAEWQGKEHVERAPLQTTPGTVGPANTHTTKSLESGEIKWMPQDTFENHCSTELVDNAPKYICLHDHSKDFHYWKYNWSSVKKFGGTKYNGLLF